MNHNSENLVGPAVASPAPPAEIARSASRLAGLAGRWWSVRRSGDTAFLNISHNIGVVGPGVDELIAEIAHAKNVELYIASTGGDSSAALGLYRALLGRCSIATITECCCSAAVFIALAAKTRRMANDAYMMIHGPQCLVLGSRAELMEKHVRMASLETELAEILMAQTSQSREQVERWLSADFYFNSEAAEAAGFIHEVFTTPATANLPASAPENSFADLAAETPDEKMFTALVCAFGKFPVANRAKFLKNIYPQIFYNIHEQL